MNSCSLKYHIVDGSEKIKAEDVERLLKMTYWADKRPIETIKKSMENSYCYGIVLDEDSKLIGFARVISDLATTFYLCDVIIDVEYQHMGLGKELVSHVVNSPEFSPLRGLLMTRDAHTLYARYGFETVENRAMWKAVN